MVSRKPMRVLILMMLACLPVMSGLAQEALTQTYSDDNIQFQYPAGWASCQNCADYVVIANSEDALFLTPDKFTSEDIQVGIFPTIQTLLDLSGDDRELGDSPADALVSLFSADPDSIETLTVGSRQIAHIIVEDEAIATSAIMVAVELGNGSSALMVASTQSGMAQEFEDVILAIAETLTAVDFEEVATTAVDPKAQSTPQPTTETAEEPDALSEIYVSDDESVRFRYPQGWEVLAEGRELYFYSDERIFDIESAADYPDGALLAALYPTPDDFPDSDFLIGGGFDASTVISFYASFGMVGGGTLDAPMDIFTLDGRDASDVLILEADGFERYYLAIEHEGDDSSLLQAIAASGQIEALKPILQAIAISIEVE